ncbi:MAG TPA: LamG domain-containing protein [Sedimentisphaerales bacterium]|nr:LamG domain-containing protein [Sedimentisphaerales bacterium]
MKKSLASASLLLITFCGSCTLSRPQQAPHSIGPLTWNVDNLVSIGGHKTTMLGAPKVIQTHKGKAVRFHGKRDGLLVHALPLAGAREFTLEILFRPDAGGAREQRFLHLQQDASEHRILIETRLTDDDRWYLDTYIETPKGSLALFNPESTHPVGQWYSAALVYDGRHMRHYVNGVEEKSGDLAFRPLGRGKTSIGVRMNQVFWFKGAIHRIRFTPRVLDVDNFLAP